MLLTQANLRLGKQLLFIENTILIFILNSFLNKSMNEVNRGNDLRKKSFFLLKISFCLLMAILFVFKTMPRVYASSIGPSIVSLYPEAGSTDVDFDGKFIIKFDRFINRGTGFFIIKNAQDDSIIATVDVKSILVNILRDTVSFVSTVDLSSYEDIYIEITDEAIMDDSGNYFAGILTPSWDLSGLAPIVQDVQEGVLIEATTRASYEDYSFIRYEYTMTRLDNNERIVCRADYSGIKKRPQRYLFPIGAKQILARFRLGKKQIIKLRRQGSRHTVTIDISCTDGSTDSHDVILTL